MQAKVTIADIAREAGVSVPTVSKVLNGRPDVAEATRRKVEELVSRHNYQRRASRRPGGAGLIDLVVNALDSPWAVEIIRGAEEVAHQAGIGTVVSAVHGSSAEVRRWLENLATRSSDGVILVVTELTPRQRRQLALLDVPLVLVDPVGIPDPGIPAIGATNWAGGLAATEHLLELGHRRIAHIAGPPRMLCSQARLDGYRAALERQGVPADPGLVRYGDFLHESGYARMTELLELSEPPTAVFAASDTSAFGAMEALRQRGLRVPADVSVVGFDDLMISPWSSPPLTTVRQPLEQMAAMAARLLLEGINEGPVDPTRIELSTSLVVRASTAAPA